MDRHVMISYNQKSAGSLARKINEALKENNIKTWIDYEMMNNDIYSAMADAIDRAFVVLVFVTNEYCASQNCVDECKNATRLNKAIIPIRVNIECNPIQLQGAVGMILGSLLYEDFAKSQNFENSFSKLLSRIKTSLDESGSQSRTSGAAPSESSNGETGVVKEANEKRSEINYSVTSLVKALKDSNLDTIKYLLEKGCKVSEKDPTDGSTTLMLAAEKGYLSIVEMLIERSVPIEAKNNLGWNALMNASYSGYVDIVRLVLQKSDPKMINDQENTRKMTALIIASQNGHADVVKVLIENRANLNSKDAFGYTSLMKASEKGHLDVVKVLVEKRCNVDYKDGFGDSALSIAKKFNNTDIVEYLKKNGAF